MAALPNLRRGIGNRVTTSLSASVTDAALTMTVSDATGMSATGGYIMIDEEYSNKREIVYVESITSNTLTISTSGRGLAGTTAVSHDSGATVTDIVVDENVNGIIDTFLVGHSDAGVHVIPNNTAITAKESGGTARDIIKVTSGNILQVGYNTLPIQTIGKWDGWNAIGDTWTYASATTITVPAGAATYYAVGDKIKLTQTTAKYFYIVAVADELLTVTGGTDYTVANEAITDIYVSKMASPVGFPARFTWSPTWTASESMTISSVSVAVAEFVITGMVIEYWLKATFTLGGTTSSQVRHTLPVVAALADNASISNGDMSDGSINLSHGLWSSGGGYVYNHKPTASNWTLGSSRELRTTGRYYYV